MPIGPNFNQKPLLAPHKDEVGGLDKENFLAEANPVHLKDHIEDQLKRIGISETYPILIFEDFYRKLEVSRRLVAGRSVLMVDDDPRCLELYVPLFVSVFGERAEFFRYSGGGSSVVVEAALKLKPDLLILDHDLVKARTPIYGPEIIPPLLSSGFTGKIIGFSGNTEPDISRSFHNAGAAGCCVKTTDAERNVNRIVELAAKLL